jgi:hypothetical protein
LGAGIKKKDDDNDHHRRQQQVRQNSVGEAGLNHRLLRRLIQTLKELLLRGSARKPLLDSRLVRRASVETFRLQSTLPVDQLSRWVAAKRVRRRYPGKEE